jgi:hypothetical protein
MEHAVNDNKKNGVKMMGMTARASKLSDWAKANKGDDETLLLTQPDWLLLIHLSFEEKWQQW